MYAVADDIRLENFGVTYTSKSFFDSHVGALYLPPPMDFLEIPQKELKQALQKDLSHLQNEREVESSQLFEDELFIERSFENFPQALKFLRKVCRSFNFTSRDCSQDIQEKLRLFDSLIQSKKKITCRFEILSGDSCKKFHIDHVNSRMICTYAGSGTQIQKVDDSEICTLPSGSALIVKGTKFPEFVPVVLHRSPPLADSGFKRLLFIADI